MGEGAEWIEPEILHHASAAVLHYFKHELQRQFVSVGEFALALEKVLRSFGLSVYADSQPARAPESAGTTDRGIQPGRIGRQRRQRRV